MILDVSQCSNVSCSEQIEGTSTIKFSNMDLGKTIDFNHLAKVDSVEIRRCGGIEGFLKDANAKKISISNVPEINLDAISLNGVTEELKLDMLNFVKFSRDIDFSDIKLELNRLAIKPLSLEAKLKAKEINLEELDNPEETFARYFFACPSLRISGMNLGGNINIDPEYLSHKKSLQFFYTTFDSSEMFQKIQDTKNVLIASCKVHSNFEREAANLARCVQQLNMSSVESLDEDYSIERLEQQIFIESYTDEELISMLKGNHFIQTIVISNPITPETRKILDQYASDKLISDGSGGGLVTYSEYCAAEEKFDEIAKSVEKVGSPLAKFKGLYNELGKRIAYDVNLLEKNNTAGEEEYFKKANDRARNIYSAILSGCGVCAGISDMFSYVSKKANLECITVTDMKENHRYNLITYLDEITGEKQKQYCDLTWDLLQLKREGPSLYFGRSKEDFKQDGHPNLAEDIPTAKSLTAAEKLQLDKEVNYFSDPNVIEYSGERYREMVRNVPRGRIEADGIRRPVKNSEVLAEVLEGATRIGDFSKFKRDEQGSFVKSLLAFYYVNAFEKGDMTKEEFEKREEHIGLTMCFARHPEIFEKDPQSVLWSRDIVEKETEDGRKEMVEEYSYYTYNQESQRFIEADREVLQQMFDHSVLELYPQQRLPGISGKVIEKSLTREDVKKKEEIDEEGIYY